MDTEVLFPSQRPTGAFMAQEDDDHHLAGLEAYNTSGCATSSWLPTPSGSVALAQMPGVDVQTAPISRPAPTPSGRWPKKSRCPSTSTAGCARRGSARRGSFKKAAASAGREIGLAEMGGPVGDASGFMSKFHRLGHLRPLPRLQMVAVECGAGLIPHFLEHMDDHYWRNRTWTSCSRVPGDGPGGTRRPWWTSSWPWPAWPAPAVGAWRSST